MSTEKLDYTKEEQELLFEEELRKSQCGSVISDDQSMCKYCQRLMSDMRKTAVRWLYMEWYKKAVLGLNLPTISELTPTLSNAIRERYVNKECNTCSNNLQVITEETLKPMKHLSDMYTTLTKNKENMMEEHLYMSNEADKENQTLAASFFVRAAQKLNLSSKSKPKKSKKKKENEEIADNAYTFVTNFSDLIMHSPPNPPSSLFKHGTVKRGDGHGKVRLVLKVVEKKHTIDKCINIDEKRKQVMLREINTSSDNPARRFEKAPRLFAFDSIYDKTSTQSDLCAGTLVDLLQAVVNGNDACLLTYGYPRLGKTSIMVGKDESSEKIGLIPCAISWLYQLIDDRKQRTGARFSIRVSAVEVVGKSENLKDLLGEQGTGSISSNAQSPSIYLPRERASGVQLSDFTELRAPNPEKAAFYFDAAITSRTRTQLSSNDDENDDERKNSSMIFTLHVYQYMIDKVGTGEIHGGRSRFHLIDLSGCSRKKRSRDTGQGSWLPLSALGNVIVSLANGAKHIPHRDSKLTTLLREAMGSLSARITMIANVSQDFKHYSESLSTLQVASRIHRSRKKKSRYSSTSSSGGDSSCDEKRKHKRRCKPVTPLLKTEACQSDNIVESEFNSTSAAEESCDTVIYVGPSGGAISDRELTDFEHPPMFNENENKNNKNIKNSRISLTNNTKKLNSRKSSFENNNNDLLLKSADIFTSEKPIVVNMGSNTLPRRSNLERKANCTLSPKKSILEEQNFQVKNNSKQKKIMIDESPKKTYYETLPFTHHKSRSFSLKIQDQTELFDKPNFTTFQPGERQCFSNDSSPCKRGRSSTQFLSLENRTASLDRALLRKEKQVVEEDSTMYKSTDTVSSNGTVDNFERQLVSKIAERFALEDEFQFVESNNIHQSEDFFIDDELDSITANLQCSSPIDDYEEVTHLVNPIKLIENSEQRENNVISCNNCIGECTCDVFAACKQKPVLVKINKNTKFLYDSNGDHDNKTNKNLRLTTLKNRNSYSSCDSHLDVGTNYKHRPPSEGVSSGYESMRCESSANIHYSGSEGERSKDKRLDPDLHHKTIYEIVDEATFTEEIKHTDKKKVAKAAHYRSQIKELIEKRQDLKEELHQTLKKLVLNKVPLPDIDERLREISTQSKDSKRLLTRENRILERKVRVCKSHLKIVNSLEPNNSTKKHKNENNNTLEKKSKYQKFSSKIKSKLTKSSNSSRQSYKVTSV